MSRSWALLTIDGPTQYGGNTGYDDDLTALYRYDSSVPNCRNLQEGDFVILRDRKDALGAAIVETIVSREGRKPRRRCPECGKTKINPRETRTPRWRCKSCRHEFAEPVTDEADVTLFDAGYRGTFVPLGRGITARSVKASALRPNDQLAIEEIDPSAIDWSRVDNGQRVQELLRFSRHMSYEVPDPGSDLPDTGAANGADGGETGRGNAVRDRVPREIAARRGQARFRRQLIRRFGGRFAVTGCAVTAALEAAHVSPYRTESDNVPSNGILLRSDIHTLYDLDLVGIDPEHLTVVLHPEITDSHYGSIAGNRAGPGTDRILDVALRDRWLAFRIRCRQQLA